jgi:hypothetical protein
VPWAPHVAAPFSYLESPAPHRSTRHRRPPPFLPRRTGKNCADCRRPNFFLSCSLSCGHECPEPSSDPPTLFIVPNGQSLRRTSLESTSIRSFSEHRPLRFSSRFDWHLAFSYSPPSYRDVPQSQATATSHPPLKDVTGPSPPATPTSSSHPTSSAAPSCCTMVSPYAAEPCATDRVHRGLPASHCWPCHHVDHRRVDHAT